MQDKSNLRPRNKKGQIHGWWERYYSNGNLCYKGYFKNGNQIGFWVWGSTDGLIEEICFYAI